MQKKLIVVDCGLTSHPAIFQLYSDGTDVQFLNFDLHPRHGQLGSLACRAYLDTGTRTSEDVFYLLAIRGPTRGEGKRGIEPGSSDPKSSPLPLRHRGGPEEEVGHILGILIYRYIAIHKEFISYRNTKCVAIFREYSFFQLNSLFFIHFLSYSNRKCTRCMPVTFIPL